MKSFEEKALERLRFLEKVENHDRLTDSELNQLMEYALLEYDLSVNGYFIKPCIQQLGVLQVQEQVLHYVFNGSFVEQAGALKLLYWVFEETTQLIFKKKKPHWIAKEEAIKNNQLAYQQRKQVLLPSFEHCTNEILRFFYPFGLQGAEERAYFEQQDIATDTEELLEKIGNNPSYQTQLPLIFPYLF